MKFADKVTSGKMAIISNIEGAIRWAENLDMPECDDYANELRTAIYRGRK